LIEKEFLEYKECTKKPLSMDKETMTIVGFEFFDKEVPRLDLG
jgi:hypothetical protein